MVHGQNNEKAGLCHSLYIDDILVASSFPMQHADQLRQVLGLLQEYSLKLHPEMCVFGFLSLNYLGYRVSVAGLEPLP